MIVLLTACLGTAPSDLTVGAAASLHDVMPRLVAAHGIEHPGESVAVTYGASGSLREQVKGGAPIDVVVFASGDTVDALVDGGLVVASTRTRVATNRLVLVSADPAAAWTFETLTALPAGSRLAIGEPGAVPAGAYAREGLDALGVWDALQDRIVYGGDVGAVATYARRGEVAAAIVYATDAAANPDLRVLDEAVGAWAPRPEVVAGVTRRGADNARSAPFLAFLSSEAGQRLFAASGFGPP